MKPELRVALLGQGFMGKAHSNAYSQAGHFYDLPYRIRRRLMCGRDAANLASMAERWGWEETSTDWRSAIERTDIDAVDISLPNHLHAPAAIAAAQAGKIILCEKPLALSLDEAIAMVVTDKLSESIDLDGGEPCIVHHDLAWNPIRWVGASRRAPLVRVRAHRP